ncbi:MAG: PIN domain-containing protein [Gemmatimonadales bacterium]|nr:PIN domain-containing protein [Gemmatimonadales bacterium]
MRVLFDTNVILDVLLARAPHVGPATALLDKVAANELDGVLGATTITTIHYLATRVVGKLQARLQGFSNARLKIYAPEELLRFLQATPQS